MSAHDNNKKYWLDDSRNVKKILWALGTVCGLLLLADLVYHKHTLHDIESVIGFHGWYGAGSICCIVLGATLLRFIVKRDEDYYD